MRNSGNCCLIFSGLYAWHACVELKVFDNLYRKQQNKYYCPCLQNYELIN